MEYSSWMKEWRESNRDITEMEAGMSCPQGKGDIERKEVGNAAERLKVSKDSGEDGIYCN